VASRDVIPYTPGYPPRVIDEKEAISKAEARTRRRLPRYIKKLEELGAGIYLVEPKRSGSLDTELILRSSDGTERVLGQNVAVYSTPPDLKALAYLVDRAMGKSPQRYEITGKEGGALTIMPWASVPKEDPEDTIEGESIEID
jgi:hypothetical protein